MEPGDGGARGLSAGRAAPPSLDVVARVLVVDNYDSFVFNLVQYLGQLGAEVDVKRNDETGPRDLAGYDGVLLSPGPGTPEDAGCSVEMVGAAEEQARQDDGGDDHDRRDCCGDQDLGGRDPPAGDRLDDQVDRGPVIDLGPDR